MAYASRALLLSRALPAGRRILTLPRPLAAATSFLPARAGASAPGAGARCFATQPATSSLRDSAPNWSNRPPKETILLDGCDFEHWLVVMEPPPGDAAAPEITRDEIIGSFIKTLAQVVGSEEEARQKIYSVSTRHYFAFGALVSEDLSHKLKDVPKVRWVLPDSYLNVKDKDYGGEPFVNGQAVPYDPKYHEEWVRNYNRANAPRRNDRPRNDRSRNFERRENMQNYQNRSRNFDRRENMQNRDGPPAQGFNGPPPPPGLNGPPPPPGQNQMPPHHGQGNMPPRPPHADGGQPNYQHQMPDPPHAGGGQPNYQHQMPNPQTGYNAGGAPHYQGGPPGYQGGNQGYQGNPGPAYQGGNPGYHGSLPGYPGVNPPLPNQGGKPNEPPPYLGGGNGNSGYPGGGPGYRGHGSNSN